jgi:hypothetical protein
MNATHKQIENQRLIDEWVQSCRIALAGTLEEPVLGACPFGRPDFIARKLVSEHLGLIPGLIAKRASNNRAGGLPQRFVMVITPTTVRAYATTGKYTNDLDPTHELAVWQRESLSVTTAGAGIFIKVTFASADTQRVTIEAVTHASTDAFIALLQKGTTR